MIVVTLNEVPGYRVVAVLGEVTGLTVRSANIGANFTAGFRAMGGGELPEYTRIMYESRNEVMGRMTHDARQRGANAIIGMRFDTGSIGQQFSEVCAYGTAVIVEPIGAGEPGATPQSAQMAVQGVGRPAPQALQPPIDHGGGQPGSPYGGM